MGFHMVRMPPEMSRGFVSTLDFGTSVVRLPHGGGDEVSRTQEMPSRYWQAVKGVFSRERIEEFAGFVQARGGSFYGFRLWDPNDFSTNPTSRVGTPSMLDQLLGYGDGVTTEFDLIRRYPSSPGDSTTRNAVDDRMLPIHDEVDDRLAAKIGLAAGTTFSWLVSLDAVSSPSSAWSIDWRRRKLVFAIAPAMDVAVACGGYYDWPARFSDDVDRHFDLIAESWTAKSCPSIGIECLPFDKLVPENDDPGGATEVAWSAGSPLIQKQVAKYWTLDPGTSGLTVTIQDPSYLNAGGPHLVLMNSGTDAVTLIDQVTGSTITTIGAAGTSTATVLLMIEIDGSTRNWFFLRMAG